MEIREYLGGIARIFKEKGSLRGVLFRPAAAAAVALGAHPYAPYFALRHGRRGNLVSAIRRQSGLDGLGR